MQGGHRTLLSQSPGESGVEIPDTPSFYYYGLNTSEEGPKATKRRPHHPPIIGSMEQNESSLFTSTISLSDGSVGVTHEQYNMVILVLLCTFLQLYSIFYTDILPLIL